MSLEKLLADGVRSGVTAVTLWPSAKGWQCNVRRAVGGTEGWRCEVSEDPVAGLRRALEGPPAVYEKPRNFVVKSDGGEDIFG